MKTSALLSRFFYAAIQRLCATALIACLLMSVSLLSSVQVSAQEDTQPANPSVTLIPEGGDFAAKNSKCGDIVERFQSGEFEIYHVPCYVQYLSQTFIYFAGGIAVLFLVIGGYQYMIGGVSEDKDAGKKTMTYALTGFAITIVAWTIVNVWQVFITSGPDESSYAVGAAAGTHFAYLDNGELNKENWHAYLGNVQKYAQERFDNLDALQEETEFEGYVFEIDTEKTPTVDQLADAFETEIICMNDESGLMAFQELFITETTQRSATKDAARLCMRKLKKLELQQQPEETHAAASDEVAEEKKKDPIACEESDVITTLNNTDGDGNTAADRLAEMCTEESLEKLAKPSL